MLWNIDDLTWRPWHTGGFVFTEIPGLARISQLGESYGLRRYSNGDSPTAPTGPRFTNMSRSRLDEVLTSIATEIGFDASNFLYARNFDAASISSPTAQD